MCLSLATRICAVGLLLFSAQPVKADPPLPVIPSRTTNVVVNFGAKGDGSTDNAGSINAAINAINAAGGGTVEIPTNGSNIFMSGPITMKSKVNLQIDSGVMLKMFPLSTWEPNYGTTTFMNGATLTDAEVSGSGTIDGQGADWWAKYPSDTGSRPHFIQFDHCTRVLIQGVTLQNPPVFTIYLKNSDTSVTIQGITINTPYTSHNTDAFDISSTNVLIRNSYISTGDDDVEIGGSGAAATDITISNCTFGTGHGVSIGSKIGGGVNNLIVSNCTFNGTEYGIKIKSDRGSGGVVENLKYCDLTMTNVNFPIAFYMNYTAMGSPSKLIDISPADAAANAPQTFSSTTPVYRNITISNLTAVGNSGIQGPGNLACFFYGVPESLISNVTLSKVNIQGRSSDGTICMYNVRGFRIIDSNLTMPLAGTNVLTLYNAQVTVTNSAANANLITMTGLAAPGTNTLSFFNAQAAITDTNLDGTAGNAGPFTLGASTLTFNQSAVNFTNNLSVVSASTLAVTSGSNTYSGTLSGSGTLSFNVPANTVLTLRGNNSGFGGGIIVSNSGTLLVNNTAGNGTGSGAVTVLSGATLGGSGVIGGPVTVNGTLAPGTSPGTLTVSNNLVANGGATLRYELGTTSDLTAVRNNLTLNGTINITNAGGFTNTTYTLFTYSGTLTNNGLTIGTTPNPSFTYTVSTSTAGQVNLIVFSGASPPVASFTGSPTNGTEPLLVTFTDTSTGTITNSFWDFGDSSSTNITTNTVAHTYSAGTYTVMLVASGPGGVSNNIQASYITVLTAFQSWQVQYFGSTTDPAAAPNADPDGDGVSNTNEFLSGTDPTNNASALRITRVAPTNDDVAITWTYGPGKTNALQETTGAGNGSYQTNDFADIFIVTNTVGSVTNYLDLGAATNSPSLYYRVRVVP